VTMVREVLCLITERYGTHRGQGSTFPPSSFLTNVNASFMFSDSTKSHALSGNENQSCKNWTALGACIFKRYTHKTYKDTHSVFFIGPTALNEFWSYIIAEVSMNTDYRITSTCM
jgi:hypothetical protein